MLENLFKHWTYRIFAPGELLREKYEAMKRLLQLDIQCHEQMAELQESLHGELQEDFCRIRWRVDRFSENVVKMVDELNSMSPGKFKSLKAYHKKFDFYTRFLLAPPETTSSPPYASALNNIEPADPNIGSKAKNLAVLVRDLNLPVPEGFVISGSGYHFFIEFNDLRTKINDLLITVDIDSPQTLSEISAELQELILTASLPAELQHCLKKGYHSIERAAGEELLVSVRSCALNEDGEYSFAGQYSSILMVGEGELEKSYKEVVASKYSPESIYYRISRGIQDEEAAMSVLVQKMVDASRSGVLYTRPVQQDEQSGEQLFLHTTKGLGDKLANGEVVPEVSIGTRREVEGVDSLVKMVPPNPSLLLTNEQMARIFQMGVRIEKYFGCPQDIEWATDRHGRVAILQSRPLLQIKSKNSRGLGDKSRNFSDQLLISNCECASPGIAAGSLYKLKKSDDPYDVPKGAVLFTEETPAQLAAILHRLVAIIAERGSRASHFATVAREFGVPCLVGSGDLLSSRSDGTVLTVDGSNGCVYTGKVEELLENQKATGETKYHRILKEAFSFLTPLELINPAGSNFSPEGCRSMHDIVRFCHEKALESLFTASNPASGRGAARLDSGSMLDVFVFDVGGGLVTTHDSLKKVPLSSVSSTPFRALWQGLTHPGVKWKQKPFDWDAYDKIELAGGIPPKKDSFAFASFAVLGRDYMHFNIRFGYHFTIVDVFCGEESKENHCMLRFAGGGGNYDNRSLRIEFLARILADLAFEVEKKGDLLEARLQAISADRLVGKLDFLGRLLGSAKLMDMVLEDEEMVQSCVQAFHDGVYSFSDQG